MNTVTATAAPIDREKTCPFLLRCFHTIDRFHSAQEFRRDSMPKDEVHIYVWKDGDVTSAALL